MNDTQTTQTTPAAAVDTGTGVVNVADIQRLLTPLAEKLAGIQAVIADLTTEADEIKKQIRALAPLGTYGAGHHLVTVSANRRLDLEQVARRYPVTEHPSLYKLSPDPTRVRQHLSPAAVEACMVDVGAPKVGVKDAQ